MKTYTKESLILELQHIVSLGWITNQRPSNAGSIGNLLEDLLEIPENNLPIPNAAEWELKAQRLNTSSLITLFHMEPSPTALRFVPAILLPLFGWPHKEAGKKYEAEEKSFRQTISNRSCSDRGFQVHINSAERKVEVSFDAASIHDKHQGWRSTLQTALKVQPYWGFDDLANKAGTKLKNCFFVQGEERKTAGGKEIRYLKVTMLQRFSFAGFLDCLSDGTICIDFDARTGHNHGTKFRIRQNAIPRLYERATVVVDSTG